MNPKPVPSPPSKEEMNLIDLPPLTKRQWVQYLPKKTPEQHQEQKEMARELGICEGDQSRALQEIPQINYTMEYVTTHLQEIPQRIR